MVSASALTVYVFEKRSRRITSPNLRTAQPDEFIVVTRTCFWADKNIVFNISDARFIRIVKMGDFAVMVSKMNALLRWWLEAAVIKRRAIMGAHLHSSWVRLHQYTLLPEIYQMKQNNWKHVSLHLQ